MTNYERPYDLLDELVGEKTVVETKNGNIFVGVLETFDQHTNVVMTDVEVYRSDEAIEDHKAGDIGLQVDTMFLKGSRVVSFRPDGAAE